MRLNKFVLATSVLRNGFINRLSSVSAIANDGNLPVSSTSKECVDDSKLNAIIKLKQADAVAFDVDSTVIQDEGIDILADYNGVGKKVAELTKNAMGGDMKFEDALSARLSIINPSSNTIKECLESHPIKLSPGIKFFIDELHNSGKHVYLVSGGFRDMIQPVAALLGIPRQRIYANSIIYDDDGNYVGFNSDELTCRDGGKAAVLEQIKKEYGYKTVVMIGDGATDLQAKPPADVFIGYGGVAERAAVKEGADWYVTDFNEVIQEFLNTEKK